MKKSLGTLAAIALGASCLWAPTAASAAKADQCWRNLTTGEGKCFTTFVDAVTDLSEGRMRVSGPASAFSAAEAETLAALSATVTIGVLYEDVSYGGASTAIVVETGPCDTDVDVDYQLDLTGSAWDNRTSSFKSYNDCATKVWTGVYAGTSYGFFVNSAGLSAGVNDQGSSVQWN